MLASVAGGFNVDLFSYLFGNILSISTSELVIAAVLFVIVITGVAIFYNDLFASTFDEELAKSSGIDTDRINAVLVLLTALTVVLAMKVVGIMLISALLILPAVSALQLAKGFRTAIVCAACIGVCTVVVGISFSFRDEPADRGHHRPHQLPAVCTGLCLQEGVPGIRDVLGRCTQRRSLYLRLKSGVA